MIKKIAITGGIGSGKSTLLNQLKTMGYICWQADYIAKNLYKRQKIKDRIRSLLGEALFVKNEISINHLQKIIYDNLKLRKNLESIIHPEVSSEYDKLVRKVEKICSTSWIFYESALIFELSLEHKFDFLILVMAEEEIRLNRLKQTRKMKEAFAKKIMQSQTFETEKVKKADLIIENSSDIQNLRHSAALVIQRIQEKFLH